MTYLIGTSDHTLLTLQLHILLFLGIGKRPRNTEEESTGADDPQRLTTEQKAGLCERCDERNGGGELATSRGREHVFQGRDTISEALAFEFDLVIVGDFGFWKLERRVLVTSNLLLL